MKVGNRSVGDKQVNTKTTPSKILPRSDRGNANWRMAMPVSAIMKVGDYAL